MSCSRCESSRLFQFEAGAAARGKVTDLPVVCRDCGLITVAGEPVNLPEKLEEAAKSLAESAAAAGAQARTDFGHDPGRRVEGYFANVYRRGYLDGLFRALALFRHDAKEGRIHRLRALWQNARVEFHPGSSDAIVKIDGDAYTEFQQLLFLKEPGDATRPSNRGPTVQKNTP